jgi:hypothetical protein
MDETRVRYKVLADFIALNRATRTARRNLRELREEEERGNAQSVAGAARAIIANQKRAASIRDLTDAYRDQESALAPLGATSRTRVPHVRRRSPAARRPTLWRTPPTQPRVSQGLLAALSARRSTRGAPPMRRRLRSTVILDLIATISGRWVAPSRWWTLSIGSSADWATGVHI